MSSPSPDSPPPASPTEPVPADPDRIGGAEQGWGTFHLVALLVITFVAAILRLWNIELWSVSSVEAETWHGATRAVPAGLSLVDWALRALFAEELLPAHGEGWLRLPFAFAGIVAVPVLAFVGAPITGRRAALLAASLLAVHPWHVEASQTASGHAPALVFALLCCGMFHAGMRGARLVWWSLAILALVAAGLCHASAWLLVPGLVVWRVLPDDTAAERLGLLEQADEPRRSLAETLAYGAAILLTVASLVALLKGPAREVATGPLALVLVPGYVTLSSLLVVAAALVTLRAQARRSPSIRFLQLLQVVPLYFAVLLGLQLLSFEEGDALVLLPSLLLLAGEGAVFAFDRLRVALKRLPWWQTLLPCGAVAVALLVDLGVGTFHYSMVQRGNRPEWRVARDELLAVAERPSLVVFAEQGYESLVYYLRPDHWRSPLVDPHPNLAVLPLSLGADDLAQRVLGAIERDTDFFCVLLDAELVELRRDPVARGLLDQAFDLVGVHPGAGAAYDETIYIYRFTASQSDELR